MKIRLIFTIILTCSLLLCVNAQKSKQGKQEKPFTLTSRMDSVSYSIGVIFGSNLIKQGLGEIDPAILAIAFNAIKNNQTPLLDEKTGGDIINKYITEIHQQKAAVNLKEGTAFLEKNKLDSGVVTLPSGLQYKILKIGTGPKPLITDKVTVNYHGTFINGKVFDSSVDRGEPIQISLDNVIEGWKEALPLMNVGSKWKIFLPASLAYGDTQQPGNPIEPNTVLIFEVELLSIDKEEPGQFQPQINLDDNKNQ